ncbi:ABC transporter substrate-binding protein [Oceanicella sp. SM1341]|uniref:ABC transporter substrate-binding protein n=1 Tax=Oceanicella sp. SM1341 TaxID=1548889 RepID=UPI000E48DD3B|nr:MqnA/MqnD/SBP family protein [Oceanicella sp. SM1341]
MKTFRLLGLATGLALGLAASAAAAKETVTFAYLSDPSQEAILWALKNGKVSSETIDVEATPLEIPALIQATSARSYDVVTTAAMAIPRALSKGLELRMIAAGLRTNREGEGSAIWVKKDSDITSVEELKGKTLAVYSLGSAGITLVRIALNKVHGLDVSLQGGDLSFVETPAPAMPAALATGKVDAATLIHAQAYQAMKSGDFVPLVETSKELQDLTGLQMVSAVLAGYEGKLDAEPEKYHEFLRVLAASRDYALAHPDEVFTAVGAEYGIEPDFFATWFERFMEYPVEMSDNDRKAITMLWDEAVTLGLLDSHPPIEDTLWKDIGGN